MEIVFVWLNNFRNLKNLQFNLGSHFLYTVEYDSLRKVCEINRSSNNTYIPFLFSPCLNISAIVGENASGKSSILEALRQILTEKRDYIEYIILFKDKDNNIYYESFFGYDYKQISTLSNEPTELNIEIVCNNFEITKNNNTFLSDTIFFSQAIDLNIYPVRNDSPLGIDISSNWLSFDDIRNTPENSGNKNLAYHKHCESLRQINFCLDAKNSSYVKTMRLPDEIEVHFSSLSYEHHNTNYSLRGYDTILLERLKKEINATNNNKKRCYLYFLSDIINCIYKNFEISNHYLTSEIKIEKSKDEISSLSIETAVKTFLLNQDLLDGKPAIELIDLSKQLIYESLESGDSLWTSKISEKTIELIQKYNNFLSSLNKFSAYSSPYGFISFDWRNMSTGEKAFLNLYSRFNHARNLINQEIDSRNDYRRKKKKLPNMIYILIDEGELGFHLQWQKDYVQNLVKNIPQILSFDNQQIDYQIIFTTHSPMSLSDIPNDRILYIQNGLVIDERMKSFGANISDLITHSFFIKNGLVGSFAIDKINETIKWLNEGSKENAGYHKLLVQNIDEPLVNRKLTEMYIKKMGNEDSKEIIRLSIMRQISEYKSKYGEEL